MIIDNFYQGQVVFNPNFFTYLNDVQNSLSSNMITAVINQGLFPSVSGTAVNVSVGSAHGINCVCPWLNNGLGASIPTILEQDNPTSLLIPSGFVGFIVAQLTCNTTVVGQSQYIFSTSVELVNNVTAIFPNGAIVSQIPLAGVTNINGIVSLNLSQGSPRIAFTLNGGTGSSVDNINGGQPNQILYQVNDNLTGFIPSFPNQVMITDINGVPQFSDVLPAVSGANLTNLPTSVLPIATPDTLGGVIVPLSGNLSIDAFGNISLIQSEVNKFGGAATADLSNFYSYSIPSATPTITPPHLIVSAFSVNTGDTFNNTPLPMGSQVIIASGSSGLQGQSAQVYGLNGTLCLQINDTDNVVIFATLNITSSGTYTDNQITLISVSSNGVYKAEDFVNDFSFQFGTGGTASNPNLLLMTNEKYPGFNIGYGFISAYYGSTGIDNEGTLQIGQLSSSYPGGISNLTNISFSSTALPIATSSNLGGVIVPATGNISVDGSGNISIPQSVATNAAFEAGTLSVASNNFQVLETGQTTIYSGVNPVLNMKYTGTNNAGCQMRMFLDPGSPIAANIELGLITFGGAIDSAGTINFGAAIQGSTTQSWSTGNNGNQLNFYTTANGSGISDIAMTLDQDKSLSVGGAISATGASVFSNSTNIPSANFINTSNNPANIQLTNQRADALDASVNYGYISFNGTYDSSGDVQTGAYLATVTTQPWSAGAAGTEVQLFITQNDSPAPILAASFGQGGSLQMNGGPVTASSFGGDVGASGTATNPIGPVSNVILDTILSDIYSAIPAATPLATTTTSGVVIVPTAGNILVDGDGNISIPQSVAIDAAVQFATVNANSATFSRGDDSGPSASFIKSSVAGQAFITIINQQTTSLPNGADYSYVNLSGTVDNAATVAPGAYVAATTSEAWSPGNTGSAVRIFTTPNGSSGPVVAATFGQDKSLTIVGNINAPSFFGSVGSSATATNPIGPVSNVILDTILSDIYSAIPSSVIKASWSPVDSSGGSLPSAVVVNNAIYSVMNNNLCMVLFDVTYPTTTGDITPASLTGLPVTPAFFGWGTGAAGTLMANAKIVGSTITFYSTAETQLTNSDLSNANLQITAYFQI